MHGLVLLADRHFLRNQEDNCGLICCGSLELSIITIFKDSMSLLHPEALIFEEASFPASPTHAYPVQLCSMLLDLFRMAQIPTTSFQ